MPKKNNHQTSSDLVVGADVLGRQLSRWVKGALFFRRPPEGAMRRAQLQLALAAVAAVLERLELRARCVELCVALRDGLAQLRVLLLERRVRRAVEEAREHRVLRHEARAASVELYCELAHDAAERDALLAEAVELGRGRHEGVDDRNSKIAAARGVNDVAR